MRRRSFLFTSSLLTGCTVFPPPLAPLRTRLIEARSPGAGPRPLLVLLPGRFMAIDEFEQHGWVETVQRRFPTLDVLLVDAWLSYYAQRTIVTRLTEDVLRPARARGVSCLWIAGISMGAYGALLAAAMNPGAVDGLVAVAPFLGDPPEAVVTEMLRDAVHLRPAKGVPPLWLAFGEQDRFLEAERALAATMPPERVVTQPGSHDWAAWEPLWRTLVERLPLEA